MLIQVQELCGKEVPPKSYGLRALGERSKNAAQDRRDAVVRTTAPTSLRKLRVRLSYPSSESDTEGEELRGEGVRPSKALIMSSSCTTLSLITCIFVLKLSYSHVPGGWHDREHAPHIGLTVSHF
ncbi:hypothetical protein BOTBODRAFT_180335 [Botryobasidium botryosum FD-172 SS1]|uniref:Uncharacterized protein n=1 Tax=Botryobasidium botryosum (strain FD-172 SS1) TaxID=930990 RepID=A0A067LZS1_BOTB1|nr:hypothetical protein BOTBODRAFT_180335 [Botryobasidium botryosum FD-172 SS1]